MEKRLEGLWGRLYADVERQIEVEQQIEEQKNEALSLLSYLIMKHSGTGELFEWIEEHGVEEITKLLLDTVEEQMGGVVH
jgi:squalene cyclase